MAGKMPKVDDGGDGTNLGDDDLVCNCHSVPKKVIRDAIKGGAHTFEDPRHPNLSFELSEVTQRAFCAALSQDIKKCTKAGTGCGTCIRTGPQPKLLSHTLNSLGASPSLFDTRRLLPLLQPWQSGVEKGCCKSLPFEADDIEDLAKARARGNSSRDLTPSESLRPGS